MSPDPGDDRDPGPGRSSVIPGARLAAGRPPASAVPAWVALTVALVVLHAAGGALPAPPLGAPSAWSQWVAGRDPVVVAFGLVRLLGLGAAWYSVAVSAVGVGLRLISARHLACLVDRVTVVPLRRLVATTVAVVVSVAPAGTAAHALTSAVAVAATTEAPPPTITMHLESPADAGPPAPPDAAPPAAAPQVSPATTTPASDATWTVRSGQCFWSIAESELSRAWGRRPTAAEIVPYWHRLIEANRSALADPGNADLIFAGQVFALPEP